MASLTCCKLKREHTKQASGAGNAEKPRLDPYWVCSPPSIQIKTACADWEGKGCLCRAFLSSESCLFNNPPLRLPPPHHHLHFRKERVKQAPALQGLGRGGSLVLYSGCLGGGLEDWDILAALEWRRRSASFGRRGGQTGGVFLRSFLFLANPRARARADSHPFGLATAGGRWRGSIPPGGRRLAARGGPPRERRSRAQEVSRSGGSGAARAAAAAPEPETLATHRRRLGFL